MNKKRLVAIMSRINENFKEGSKNDKDFLDAIEKLHGKEVKERYMNSLTISEAADIILSEFQPIQLKPLSEITDEDKKEVGRLLGYSNPDCLVREAELYLQKHYTLWSLSVYLYIAKNYNLEANG